MAATKFTDYLTFLQELGASGTEYFLKGGQAVNFWAEYYSAQGAEESLSAFMPFTSKDCDVWVSHMALKYLRSKTDGGRLVLGKSPADGQIGVLSLPGTPIKRVDIMTNVYGIPPVRNRQLLNRSLEINGIRIIDPIFLFVSKCHCLCDLDQRGRQDKKHLTMLALIVPEHLTQLLDQTDEGHISQRALLNELKLLQKYLKTNRVRRALEEIAINAEILIPANQLLASKLSKIKRFASSLTPNE